MKGYEFHIWQPIYHNKQFSHYVRRNVIVHARSEAETEDRLHLRPSSSTWAGDLCIRAEEEFVHSSRCLGYVHHEVVVKYRPERP